MKLKLCITSLVLVLNLPAWGALYGEGTLTPGGGGSSLGTIPDYNTIGFSDALIVSGLGSSLTDLTLTFALQGGFANDLSGYLRLGNQIDSTAYSLTSLVQSQTLSEGTPTTYTINFGTTAFSTAFNNQNPNNTWTLFFADQSPGGVTHLNGWSLDITPVPEPVNVALGIFGGVMGLMALARSRSVKRLLGKS